MIRYVRQRALVAACALALLPGCSSEEARSEPKSVPRPPAPRAGTPAPELGRTLLDFLRAAEMGDVPVLWRALSPPTRESFGPTLPAFRRGALPELRKGPGVLARTARVIFARRVTPRWGVAAVGGERSVDGELEAYAYAAVFGGGRIELDGLVLAGLDPDPLDETGAAPRVRLDVSAGAEVEEVLLWLDGRPLAVRKRTDAPFSARVHAQAPRLGPGRHDLVAFATAGKTAGAIAWTFSVRP